MQDKIGNEIKPGDTLVWAATRGRSAILKQGVVDSVQPNCVKTKAGPDCGWSFLRHSDRCLVIPS